MTYKVLIGSPIRQVPNVLEHFLESLNNLKKNNIEVSFYFVDDNEDNTSKILLQTFSDNNPQKVLIKKSEATDKYLCNEDTHFWNEDLIWKVAEYKNTMLSYCKENNYDYIFFIDSDLVLHPNTLEHLISTNKDIISEIFWTKWHPDAPELPQIWLYDQYSLIKQHRKEQLTEQEKAERVNTFLNMLKQPGIYEVGGLGACTLISKKALNENVNFSEISNISFWGEDRHFSIRAAAIGFKLFVDTTYPAYHIYRQSNLQGIEKFKNNCITQITDKYPN
ncbi:MAG: glycosyltransferase family 2 protein, partial [Eubacteriales bacterium]